MIRYTVLISSRYIDIDDVLYQSISSSQPTTVLHLFPIDIRNV